jgi:hypothetical protein
VLLAKRTLEALRTQRGKQSNLPPADNQPALPEYASNRQVADQVGKHNWRGIRIGCRMARRSGSRGVVFVPERSVNGRIQASTQRPGRSPNTDLRSFALSGGKKIMIRCHQCSIDNLDGSEYCDECGTKLSQAPPLRAAPQPASAPPQFVPPPPPAFARENITPKPATPYTAPPPAVPASPQLNQTAVNPSASSTGVVIGQTSSLRPVAPPSQAAALETTMPSLATRAKLVIQRGGKVGKEFPLLSDEAMIGRWDADGGIFPDVDLDQDDPEAKVSRRHARIHFLNNQFLIEDLGSTNGTFVNRGPRLLPGHRQALKNGDEIIVGKTFLKFVVN